MSKTGAVMAQWRIGSDLKLAFPDKLKFVAVSFPRLAKLTGAGTVQIQVLEQGKSLSLPLRPNGQDVMVVEDLFLKRPYDMKPDQSVKTILDLGGNIGMATLLLHTRFPEASIAAVEPMPDNFAMLKETLRLNRIQATVFNAAVGIEDGQMKLHVADGGNSSSAAPWFDHSQGREISVRQMSIPTIMAELGWSSIDLLKVDIEGYEKTLFSSNNDWLRNVNVIIGEAHAHVQYGMQELAHDLSPFGFEVTQRSKDSQWGMTIFEARNSRVEATMNPR